MTFKQYIHQFDRVKHYFFWGSLSKIDLKGDYRYMIHLQVLHCIACLKEEAEYHPFKIR